MASAADIPSRRLFAISMSPAERSSQRECEVPSTAGTWIGAAKVTNEHLSSSHAQASLRFREPQPSWGRDP